MYRLGYLSGTMKWSIFVTRLFKIFDFYKSYLFHRKFNILLLFLSHRWLPTLLILAYMGTVIVVLLNILIAQMSDTYAQAKRVARLQYDVDRIALINRMETLPFFVSKLFSKCFICLL